MGKTNSKKYAAFRGNYDLLQLCLSEVKNKFTISCKNGNTKSLAQIEAFMKNFCVRGSVQIENCRKTGIIFKLSNHFCQSQMIDDREGCLSIGLLLCRLLFKLYHANWKLHLRYPTSTSHTLNTLVFSPIPKKVSLAGSIICVTFAGHNKLYLINGTEKLNKMIQFSIGNDYSDYRTPRVPNKKWEQFVIEGTSWTATNRIKSVRGHRIALNIIRSLNSMGYQIYGNVTIKNKSEHMFFLPVNVLNEEPIDCHNSFFILTLNGDDKIRLIDADDVTINIVKKCIHQIGINYTEQWYRKALCTEFKLDGFSWCTGNTKYFLTILLEELLANGWSVYCTLDVTRKGEEHIAFVMKSCLPQNSYFTISPVWPNMIIIENCSQNDVVIEEIVDVLKSCWPAVIEKQEKNKQVDQIFLNGLSWNNTNEVQSFMGTLLLKLETLGYEVVFGANLEIGSNDKNVITWFLTRTTEKEIILQNRLSKGLKNHIRFVL